MDATEKQIDLINKIENLLYLRFKGRSVSEASSFISKHIADYREAKKEADGRFYDAMYEAGCYGDK